MMAQTESYPSIHQLEYEAHADEPLGPPPMQAMAEGPMAPLSNPVVNKEVFGFLTYWNRSTNYIQWDLLTIISYFGVEINAEGDIINWRGWPAYAPIAEAQTNGVKMLVTVILFDGADINTLLHNTSYQQNLFENLWNSVSDAGADGVCIDFEIHYTSDAEELADFMEALAYYFHSRDPNQIVSICLWSYDFNNRYHLNDMVDHADSLRHTDYFFQMGYGMHWSGGDPGPGAPFYSWTPWGYSDISIKKAVEKYIYGTYGLGDTHKDKFIIGLPYYGRDWPATSSAYPDCDSFPESRLGSGSSVVYSTAYTSAQTYGRKWDIASLTPYYVYDNGGTCHQAWYDDYESLSYKYNWVNLHGIGGVGMWALNYDGSRPELWNALREFFTPTGGADDIEGMKINPISINSFPFQDYRNTDAEIWDEYDTYNCSPSDEYGPEVFYSIAIPDNGTLSIDVSDGSNVDVDIHLLDALSSTSCLERNDSSISRSVTGPDTYYLVVDTFGDGSRTSGLGHITNAGPYTLDVNFVPDSGWQGDRTNPFIVVWQDNPSPPPDKIYSHTFDTSNDVSDYFNYYSCAPDTNETGSEVVYQFTLSEDGVLDASLSHAGYPSVDVDIHLMQFNDPLEESDCLARDNWAIEDYHLTAGTYYIIVDTFNGDSHAGAYTLNLEFTTDSSVHGTCANPIVMQSFPFNHSYSTSGGPSDIFDSYIGCGSGQDESGPEVIYMLEAISGGGELSVSVSDGIGVDIDIHLLSDCDSSTCLIRDDSSFSFELPSAGTYYVIADTFQSNEGDYTLDVDYIPHTQVAAGINLQDIEITQDGSLLPLLELVFTTTQYNFEMTSLTLEKEADTLGHPALLGPLYIYEDTNENGMVDPDEEDLGVIGIGSFDAQENDLTVNFYNPISIPNYSNKNLLIAANVDVEPILSTVEEAGLQLIWFWILILPILLLARRLKNHSAMVKLTLILISGISIFVLYCYEDSFIMPYLPATPTSTPVETTTPSPTGNYLPTTTPGYVSPSPSPAPKTNIKFKINLQAGGINATDDGNSLENFPIQAIEGITLTVSEP